MKHKVITLKYILLSSLLSSAILLLSACGGTSSSSSSYVDSNSHPKFFRGKVTDSPSYAPSGKITQTMPTFSWKAIRGASRYQFGHEAVNDESQWRSYNISANEAGCQNSGDVCTYTPTDYTFPQDVEKAWWLRANVNGQWQNWSRPIVFTVVEDASNSVGILIQILPSGQINTAQPVFSWTPVAQAVEYKLGYENSNTQEGWTEIFVSALDANCQSGSCSRKITSSLPGDHIAWWVKAKNAQGKWSHWSAGLNFSVNTSVILIPDEPYQYLCNNINNGSSAGNLVDGIIFNGKRYFTDPANDHLLKVSDINGANEQLISDFQHKVSLASLNGALYVKITYHRHSRPTQYGIKRITGDNSIVHITGYTPGINGSARSFTYQNGFDFYYRSRMRPPGGSFRRQVSSNSYTALLSLHIGQRFSTYYYEGVLYYSFLSDRTTPKTYGKLNSASELESLGSCN